MNNIVLVIINGHAGVGKDTFVQLCTSYAERRYMLPVFNFHRSDAPKEALSTIGWDGQKDAASREILKQLVDYMELKGLLNKRLKDQLKWIGSHKAKAIVFYHVRDPKVIEKLMHDYAEDPDVAALSLLILRDMPEPEEPSDWWDDLESAEYMIRLSLPTEAPNDLQGTTGAAESFTDFLMQYLQMTEEVK